jgi:hypothetical protein
LLFWAVRFLARTAQSGRGTEAQEALPDLPQHHLVFGGSTYISPSARQELPTVGGIAPRVDALPATWGVGLRGSVVTHHELAGPRFSELPAAPRIDPRVADY